jgi:hypothetical protein
MLAVQFYVGKSTKIFKEPARRAYVEIGWQLAELAFTAKRHPFEEIAHLRLPRRMRMVLRATTTASRHCFSAASSQFSMGK